MNSILKNQSLFLSFLFLFAASCSTKKTEALHHPRSLSSDQQPDPFLWLEDIRSDRSMTWVKAHDAISEKVLEGDPLHGNLESEIRKIVLAKDRLPTPVYLPPYVYNFWQDETHVRGIWRRTPEKDYLKSDIPWETVIDIDALATSEKENWVFKVATCLPPANERCLISLSRAGKDAVVVREFDTKNKAFVADGFTVPEAKQTFTWFDKDHLLIGTDFGPNSMTDSGYPRQIHFWARGTQISQSKLVYESQQTDVGADPFSNFSTEGNLFLILRSINFYENEVFLLKPDLSLEKLPIPSDTNMELSAYHDGKILFTLRSDWTVGGKTFKEASLMAISATDFKSTPTLVFEPDQSESILGIQATKSHLYLSLLKNVQGEIRELAVSKKDAWTAKKLKFPPAGSLSFVTANEFGEKVFYAYENFLVPSSIYLSDVKSGKTTEPKVIKQAPVRFDATGMKTEQFFASSKDGTQVPYFLVSPKNLVANGKAATIQYGYGGFEISRNPFYLGATGKIWLEKGGVYVLANIRGGGEFGPRWHKAALKENRQKAFDDFEAVSEDLIKRQITSNAHLGIWGGSNGGLLVSTVMVQRPELYNAVVCQVPLTDMLRYNQLLAGASWMGEYGDPADPVVRAALLAYSPYQNVKKDAHYPKAFFITSTADDRVHPGHARKMAAKLESFGHDLLYWENTEGGHGAAANLEQKVKMNSLIFTYLHQQLKPGQ